MAEVEPEEVKRTRIGGKERRKAQFKALLRKNFIVKTRGAIKAATVLEMLLPAVFFVLMCIPRALIAEQFYNTTIYPARDLGAWRWGQTCPIGYQIRAVGSNRSQVEMLGRESVKRLVCGSQYQLPKGEISQPDVNLTQTVVEFAFERDLSSISRSEATELANDFLQQNPQNFLLMATLCNLGQMAPADIINALLVLESSTFSRACSIECQLSPSCERDEWDRLLKGNPYVFFLPQGNGFLKTHSDEAEALQSATTNTQQTLAVVNFDNISSVGASGSAIGYRMRTNGSYFGDFYEDNFEGPLDTVAPPEGWAQTFPLVNVQNAVEGSIVQDHAQAPVKLPTSLKQQPWLAYSINVGSTIAAVFLSTVVSLAFSTSSVLVLKSVVQEKELRLREAMRVMGMTDFMFWLSWFITHWTSLAITSFIVSLIGVYPFAYSEWTVNFVFFLFWTANLVAFNYMLAAFFDNSRLAATLGWFVYVLTITPSVAAHSLYVQGSAAWTWSTFVPASAIHGWGQILARLEVEQKGLRWSNFSRNVAPKQGYFRPRDVLLITIAQMFIYAFLAWYFDNVWPSKYGQKRHPLFFVSVRYWCGNRQWYRRYERDSASSRRLMNPTRHVESPKNNENLTPEKEAEAAIKIQGLCKRYSRFDDFAVDNLTVSFARNEVGALLGQVCNHFCISIVFAIVDAVHVATNRAA